MPIFKGTWLDDEGVGFDADSFVLHTTGGVTIIDVTGDPSPDCTGHYNYIGEIGGKPYYTRDPAGFSIWWSVVYGQWILSLTPGTLMPGFWHRADPVEGTYVPDLAASGNVTAAFRRGGIARPRIHGRRGGSGSPPGMYHGNALQAAERLAFGNAARRYVDMPEASPETEWERDGDHKNWLVRSGQTKTMHGQAFYPRTSVPQDYVAGTCADSPDVAATVSPLASFTFYYDPGTNECNLTIFSDDTTWYGADGGFSIFQINPRAAEKSWERKHTRIVWSTPTWGQSDSGAEYVFTPAWPADVATGIRILGIGRNNVAFIHYGPWNSEAAP